MATIIQNIKSDIELSVHMYKYNVQTEQTEYIEMWRHHIDQIRTTIFMLWSMNAITMHAYNTLTTYLRKAVLDTDLEPKTL